LQVVVLLELERNISLDMFWAFKKEEACQYAPLNENIYEDIFFKITIFFQEDLQITLHCPKIMRMVIKNG